MSRGNWVAGVLAVAALAGCKGTPRPGNGALDSGGPTPKLTAPQVADVQVALGRTLESRGEMEGARGYYAEAARRDPKRADAWARQAVLADKEGKFAESGEFHRRALELEPANPDLHCNLGYSLYLQERWAEAEAALRKAVGLKPDHPRANNNLGLVLARVGRADDALACFSKAGCSKADAYANLSYALTLKGELDWARANYEVALKHDPKSETARKGLERLDLLVAKLNPPAPSGDAVVPASATVPVPGLKTR